MIKETTSADTGKDTKPCAYKQPVLVRVLDKLTGELLGYLAEPEITHQYGDLGMCKPWYRVTRTEENGFMWWRCTCKGSAVYGHRCKHIKAAMILCGEIVVAEPDVLAEEEVLVAGDMSVGEHLLEEELAAYERELRYEGLADLRMRIAHAGLSVTSKSKEPLIMALVQHRRDAILHPVIVLSLSPECPQDAPVEEQEFSDDVAEQWTQEEIVKIREAALPKYDRAALGGRIMPVVVATAASSIEAGLVARGLMR